VVPQRGVGAKGLLEKWTVIISATLSKTKLQFGIGGSILFVALGLYLFTTIANQQTRFDPTLVKVVGIANILFFGATGIYGIKKMFDNNDRTDN